MTDRVLILRALALCGAFLIALLAAGCWEPEPSPEPPPPPVTDPEKLAPHVRYNQSLTGFGIRVDKTIYLDRQGRKKTIVRAKLIELGASLRDGKVVDAAGQELCFFRLFQPHRPDRRAEWEEDKQLLRMEEKYHVVRMYGGPTKD
jgi:hypothetical protein